MSKSVRRAAGVMGICAMLGLAVPVAFPHPEGEPWGKPETEVRRVFDIDRGESVVIDVDGAGFFHAAEIVKTGGASDETLVVIEMDGRSSMDYTFASLSNQMRWLQSHDMVANVKKAGDTGTMTLWFRAPIEYRDSLKVSVHVGEEGVSSLNLRVLHSTPDEAGDHEEHDH